MSVSVARCLTYRTVTVRVLEVRTLVTPITGASTRVPTFHLPAQSKSVRGLASLSCCVMLVRYVEQGWWNVKFLMCGFHAGKDTSLKLHMCTDAVAISAH
jgi:hypothetical protein